MLMTAIVLAGGRSLRLGRDKALEEIGGLCLIERVIERLAKLGDEIIVVTSSSDQFADIGVKQVIDCYPGKGALIGIYSGLKEADSLHNIVVGCDMPFLSVDLLRYLMALSPGYDIIIPRFGDKVEPLHAVYSRDCMAPIEQQLREGRFKLSELLDSVKVRYVEGEEIERHDPEHLSFFNINYESDLHKAKRLLERKAK
jgi:molybdopterin-guanine dinucleotide biosynthesis protein A